jgi:hypothetical protein
MLGYQEARLAERSRPNFTPELAEFARLEYPREDPRTVGQLVVASVENAMKRPRWRFRFSRDPKPTAKVGRANV